VTEKFTYMDFLMYVLPGGLSLVLCINAYWLVSPTGASQLPLLGTAGLFASVVFILLCFVAGNLVQTIAHAGPEQLHRFVFWNGHWPSDLVLLEGSFRTGLSKKTVLHALRAAKLIDDDLEGALTAKAVSSKYTRRWYIDGDAAPAVRAAAIVFGRTRSLLADAGVGTRANVAEAYYQLFRGMYTVGLVGAPCFLVLWIDASWKAKIGLSTAGVDAALPSALFCTLLLVAFSWRARGAGANFAKEVYVAATTAEVAKSLAAAASIASNNPTNQG